MKEQWPQHVALRLTDAAIKWIKHHPPSNDSIVDPLTIPGRLLEGTSPVEELFREPSEYLVKLRIDTLTPAEQERICIRLAWPEDSWPIRKEVKQDERSKV